MEAKHRPHKILVVDNNDEILNLCKTFLSQAGYDVLIADKAEEALRIVRTQPVDLVLTDLKMPEMDGIELMHALMELDPALGVMVMTGHASMDFAISALKAGALDFLEKPLDSEALQLAASQGLDRVRLRGETARLRLLAHLMAVNEAIASSLDLSDLFRKVLEAAAQETRSTRGSIMLEDSESGELYIAESVGWDVEEAKQVRIRPGEGIAGKVFAEDESLVVRDIQEDPRFHRPSGDQYKTGSFLVMPMRTRKQKVGVLNLNDKERDLPFTEADEEIVSILATQAAIVYDNARLLEEERERSKQLETALQDVGEAQEQLVHSERLAAMGQLAASIVHELRNPLHIIRGRVQLFLSLGDENEELKRKTVNVALEQCDRLAGLVNNILSFSRKQESEARAVQINTVMENLLEFLQGVRGKRVEIHTEFAPDLPDLCADPNELEQVFMNLIINAFDALEDEGALRISTGLMAMSAVLSERVAGRPHVLAFRPEEMAVQGDLILVEISDEGPGISEDNLQRIFEPFFTTKGESSGTGLGLAICRGIVEKYGGNILMTSREGDGVSVCVLLPAESGEAPDEDQDG